jgi:hypothetical protein
MFPTFFVIGAQKSGTSSLHEYLDRHPDISMPRPKKEVNFFLPWIYPRGTEWYLSHFRDDGLMHGEASPEYTNYPYFGDVAPRMHEHVPDARLIYIMRDPVARLVSHWQHVYAREIIHVGLAELTRGERFGESEYVWRSRYMFQLDRYREHFGDDAILLLTFEELVRDSAATMATVYRFLGVAEGAVDPDAFGTLFNPSAVRRRARPTTIRLRGTPVGRAVGALARRTHPRIVRLAAKPLSQAVPKPVLEPEVRRRIEAALVEDVARLRAHTGRDFAEWSI